MNRDKLARVSSQPLNASLYFMDPSSPVLWVYEPKNRRLRVDGTTIVEWKPHQKTNNNSQKRAHLWDYMFNGRY